MTDINYIPKIVCFGEVLWEIFPTYKRIGGAPFNVAYHLSKMGIYTSLITRIGHDEYGTKILDRLNQVHIKTTSCQTDNLHPTGSVFTSFDEHNEAIYDFSTNSAWDNIELRAEDLELIENADAFVFGTLASRKNLTRTTLHQLLEAATYKVYDVNFRPPHYEMGFVIELMHKSDLIKMNKSEMKQILDHIGKVYTTDQENIKHIQDHFNCNELLITDSSKGGMYVYNNTTYYFPAVPIVIRDTVGSGDAFLAGFLSEKIKNDNTYDIVKKASALGAFITSHTGACPDYDLDEFLDFYTTTIYEDKLIKVTEHNVI
ncbi:MAG: carbohydrate kinase [Flavobacteriaceae bacterium]|jgi:fructokinase|nr:carbohydrate kinase [Flavobacteriaceae bacterium]